MMTDQGEDYFHANIWEKGVFKDKVDKKLLFVNEAIDKCKELNIDNLLQQLIEHTDDVI